MGNVVKSTNIRIVTTALVVLGLAADGAAQSAPRDLALATLEELLRVTITTASRGAETAADAPARVQVVTAADIERRGYRSLAEVLKDLPDVKVDLAGDQDYPTELTIQGTRGASRVVLLLDGIRISSPTNEPLPILANYPVHGARQIEIVYGPASALYGADAFSAVINIISKDADEASGLAVASSVGQFGLYNQTASFGRRFGSRTSLVVAGQFLHDRQPDLSRYYPEDFGGLQAQRTGVFNTIFGPMTAAGRLSPEFDIPLSAHSVHATLRSGGLQLSLFENHSRVSNSPAYTPDNAVYNPAAFNRNSLLVGAATYTRTIGGVTSTSSLTASRHELDPESGYWNVYSNLRKSYKYAFGSMVKLDEQLSWKPAGRLTVTTGGTYERFFSIPQGADLNAPIESRDRPGTILDTDIADDFIKVRSANVGAFGQLQYALAPALAITLGARTDYSTRYGGTFNPRLGLVARPGPQTTLKLLYGTAFLAPSPYQAFAHYGSFYSVDGGSTYQSSFWHLGNAALKPQHKRTVEVSLTQTVGDSLVLSASAFRSALDSLIKESDAARSYAGSYHGWPVDYIEFPVNEGHSTIYGGTVEADVLKSFALDRRIQLRAAVSVADGWVWDRDQLGASLPIGGMAPVQFRAGADVDWGRWTAGPRLIAVGRQRVLATTLEGGDQARRTLDGYVTVDIAVRRRNVLKHVDAFIVVDNALDQRYRAINARAYNNPEELIGAPQHPRRVTVGLDVRLPIK